MVNLVTAILSEHMMGATAQENAEEEASNRQKEWEDDRFQYMKTCYMIFTEFAKTDENDARDGYQQGSIGAAEFRTIFCGGGSRRADALSRAFSENLAGYKMVMGDQEVLAYYNMMDTDASGRLNVAQFLSGMLRLRGNAEAKHLYLLQSELESMKADIAEVISHNFPDLDLADIFPGWHQEASLNRAARHRRHAARPADVPPKPEEPVLPGNPVVSPEGNPQEAVEGNLINAVEAVGRGQGLYQ